MVSKLTYLAIGFVWDNNETLFLLEFNPAFSGIRQGSMKGMVTLAVFLKQTISSPRLLSEQIQPTVVRSQVTLISSHAAGVDCLVSVATGSALKTPESNDNPGGTDTLDKSRRIRWLHPASPSSFLHLMETSITCVSLTCFDFFCQDLAHASRFSGLSSVEVANICINASSWNVHTFEQTSSIVARAYWRIVEYNLCKSECIDHGLVGGQWGCDILNELDDRNQDKHRIIDVFKQMRTRITYPLYNGLYSKLARSLWEVWSMLESVD